MNDVTYQEDCEYWLMTLKVGAVAFGPSLAGKHSLTY